MVRNNMHCLVQKIGLLCFLFVHNVVSQSNCLVEKACELSDISTSGSNILCYGYRACQNCTSVTITSGSSRHLLCDASHSCIYTSGVTFSDTSYNMYCGGVKSCSHLTLDNLEGILWCHGTASCYSSIMHPDDDVYCFAERSCSNILIEGGDTIYGYGSYSLYNSIVDSENTGTIGIKLKGYMAGYNLTFICQSSATQCTFECEDGACLGANFICDSGQTECIYNETILYKYGASVNGVPYGSIQEESLNLDEIIDILSEINENDNICKNSQSVSSNVTRCADSAECEASTTISNEIICCIGDDSCRDTSIIIGNNKVICSGHSGCRNVNVLKSGNTIYCTSSSSCEESKILNSTNVLCSGYEGCYATTISNIYNRITCMGYKACAVSVITNVANIYLAGYQAASSSIIASDGVGTMNVYLLAAESGSDGKIYCNTTDTCNIYCNYSQSCKDLSIYRYYGSSLTVECNETDAYYSCPFIFYINTQSPTNEPSIPSNNPTDAPSKLPTIMPTTTDTTNSPTNATMFDATADDQFASEEDSNSYQESLETFSTAYYYIIFVFFGILIIVFVFGYIDAHCIRRFEMYRHWSVLLFGLYTLDFISDLFFMGQVWIVGEIGQSLSSDDSDDNKKSGQKGLSFEFYIFCFAVLFIIVPLFGTLFQLQSAIKGWIFNPDCKQIVRSYVKNYIKFLYFISFVSGSSFSGLELCNSFLFQWPIFGLDLPKQQRSLFKNKRIFSVVLMENIPQFVIQTAFSVHVGNMSVITLFSIIFSLLSIILTFFEFYAKKLLLHTETIIVIKFNIESNEIQSMSYRKFDSRIAYRRRKIQSEMSKILGIEYVCIELLKPVRNTEGASFTFYIRNDDLTQSDILFALTQQYTPNTNETKNGKNNKNKKMKEDDYDDETEASQSGGARITTMNSLSANGYENTAISEDDMKYTKLHRAIEKCYKLGSKSQSKGQEAIEMIKIDNLEIKTVASEYDKKRSSFVAEPTSIKLQSYIQSESVATPKTPSQ